MAYIYTRADYLAQEKGAFEPQRSHNWAIEIVAPAQGGVGFTQDTAADIIKLSLVQGFLPTTYNEDIAISYGNEEVFVAGKAKVEQGQLVCRDWVDAPTASILLNWRRSVYNPLTGSINLARNYKTQASIILSSPNVVDGADEAVPPYVGYDDTVYTRVWKLQGCWPIGVNPAVGQGLDMTTSGMVMIAVTLRFDKAIPAFAYGTGASANPTGLPTFTATTFA